MFPTFQIFGKEIGMYGVMTVIGILICGLVGSRLIKRFGIDFCDMIIIMLSIGGGVLIVSHIVYGITHIDIIIRALGHIQELWFKQFFDIMVYCFGGMVFYGGFIGGALAIPIYCKFNKKINALNIFDIYAVLVPLFHTFGRIGCFLGGCCYGIESSFGFTVQNNTINPSINDVNRLPIQLIESGCNFLIFLFIYYLFKKSFMSGRLIYVYMLIYPVVRFILEFFRGDEIRGFLFGLSTSQWISIVLFAIASIYLIVRHFRNKKQTSLTY